MEGQTVGFANLDHYISSEAGFLQQTNSELVPFIPHEGFFEMEDLLGPELETEGFDESLLKRLSSFNRRNDGLASPLVESTSDVENEANIKDMRRGSTLLHTVSSWYGLDHQTLGDDEDYWPVETAFTPQRS